MGRLGVWVRACGTLSLTRVEHREHPARWGGETAYTVTFHADQLCRPTALSSLSRAAALQLHEPARATAGTAHPSDKLIRGRRRRGKRVGRACRSPYWRLCSVLLNGRGSTRHTDTDGHTHDREAHTLAPSSPRQTWRETVRQQRTDQGESVDTNINPAATLHRSTDHRHCHRRRRGGGERRDRERQEEHVQREKLVEFYWNKHASPQRCGCGWASSASSCSIERTAPCSRTRAGGCASAARRSRRSTEGC